MDIPATMRAAVLRAPGETLSIETIPTPRPRANEVLLKVAACGLCHSDLHVLGGAINPLKLVEKYGSPLYVYEADIIERQYNRLKAAFKVEKLKISYACKALTNISILKFMKQLGSTVDCVSIQEVQIAMRAGFEPVNILYTPSGVNFSEIEEDTISDSSKQETELLLHVFRLFQESNRK